MHMRLFLDFFLQLAEMRGVEQFHHPAKSKTTTEHCILFGNITFMFIQPTWLKICFFFLDLVFLRLFYYFMIALII